MNNDGLGPLLAGRSQPSKILGSAPSRRLHFLLAHENLSLRKFIKGSLQNMGAASITEMGATGNVLTTLLREGKTDVLIVSGEIPEMREWKLVKAIRSQEALGRLKVVVVSGNPDRNEILAAIEAGIDDYIILPFSAAAFQDRMRTLLTRRRK